ncbi:MAG TPA: helix-turn-helix domain-containing protein [Actinoplanes sp.]|nr:helix-turn-helix domain-containing protein [Actinoplanes sp.]
MHEDLAGRLRQLRDLTGCSLRELARETRISSSSLSRYLAGQAVPPWPAVVALCRAAGRDPRPLRELWEQARDHRTETPAAVRTRNDLPHDVDAFTGRAAELRTVLAAAGAGRMVAIDGMGGVGKSALAVHAAHRLSDGFPGGRFYLDLRGFTPGRIPIEPAEALRVLLTAIGVAPGRIPERTAERAALWRSELAPHRALIVLDNAADENHVRDLLPGAGPSTVLITSRRRMVALDGVQPVSLDVLPADDAARLFTAAVGNTRPGDVGEVLRRCGNLPLALRVAAARLRHRPTWTMDTLVERMLDSELAAPDLLAASLQHLDPPQRRMFGLLGLVPGDDIDAYGAAALADLPMPAARSLLDDLVDVHLVEEPAPGRYRMHDLLHQTARADFGDADPVPAITRLGAYHRSGLLAARRIAGFLVQPPIREPQPQPALPGLPNYEAALDWINTEWENLTAMLVLAVELGADELAAGLGQLLSVSHARRNSRTAQMYQWLRQSLPAAERLGDRRLLAHHRYLLGAVGLSLGRLTDAVPELEAARTLLAAEEQTSAEAFTLLHLAEARLQLRDTDRAVAIMRDATMLRSLSSAIQVRVAAYLGKALVRSGRFAEGRAAVAGVSGPARDADPQTRRMYLDVLGWAALGEGDAAAALDYAQQCLELNRAARNPVFQASSLTDVAIALRHLGRPAEADARQAEALSIPDLAGEPPALARCLIDYAQACLDTGDPGAAETGFETARDLVATHGLSHPVPGHRVKN